ncbi:MAG: hypothetical protein ACE5FL_07545 [Myxococcota bacterium]
MESIYIWPGNPALSLLLVLVLSMVFLWAAREPMLEMLRSLGKNLQNGFGAAARWCASAADGLQARSRESLLAAAELELHGKLDRELQRIDATFSEKVGQYSTLHRRLDDLLRHLDADCRKCGDSPPDVPGWSAAVEAVASIPTAMDPNVKKVLEGIEGSMRDAEKKALKTYRNDTARRHRILNGMRPNWKAVQGLMARMQDSVAKVLATTSKIDRYVDEYGSVVKERESGARIAVYSAFKPFFISLLVLSVSLGGAFVNFQLIALPMSELVPAGARIGGLPVATVSALVLVLMEAAVGIFLMDMLGITELFPKLSNVELSRRRLILFLSAGGLFFLASVESSLAILREQIVEADAALKLSLAGSTVVARPADSSIPVIGQAVLGFVLPWILAMIAIPLEMLLDSGRHVLAQLGVGALRAVGHTAQVLAHLVRSLTNAIPSVYDVYVAIPLRIERTLKKRTGEEMDGEPVIGEPNVTDAEVAR